MIRDMIVGAYPPAVRVVNRAIPGHRGAILEAEAPMRQVVGELQIGREQLGDVQPDAVGLARQRGARSQIFQVTHEEAGPPFRIVIDVEPRRGEKVAGVIALARPRVDAGDAVAAQHGGVGQIVRQ